MNRVEWTRARALRRWLRRRWAPMVYRLGYLDGFHDGVADATERLAGR